jgi:hypothetical protein
MNDFLVKVGIKQQDPKELLKEWVAVRKQMCQHIGKER